MTNIRILIILSLFLYSCTTLKKAEKNSNQVFLNAETLTKLNGVYDIFTKDTATTTLDLSLTLKKYWWFDWNTPYKLSIKAIDGNHLHADIYRKDSLIDTKIIKGKIKDGYFEIKSTKVIFFYLLLNGFGNMTTRIGLLNSGDLLVDSHHSKVATLIIIPLTGDRVQQYGLVFPRQTDSR
jgi:hypothetical protein